MLKYDFYGIDGAWGGGEEHEIGKGGRGDGGRDGSRHALGMLKYYYYEIDGAWGGRGEEMN